MHQLFHSLATGEQHIAELPTPLPRDNHLISQTRCSLLSSGTERMLLDFGKGSFLQKAKQQPDKVKQVIEKIKTDGLISTFDAVRSKLSTPIPLGYSNVGIVTHVGNGCTGFSIGDRIVSNGAHAEMVSVPYHLAAKIPDEVSDEAASFAVVGSIGLHGVRLLKCEIGESCLVIGLGLIGLITVQILKASGVQVIACDLSEARVALAKQMGVTAFTSGEIQVIKERCLEETDGVGVDCALITAATKDASPLFAAAESSRKRGRIVLTGVCDITLQRDLFYKKELSFQVSCSYGPGRYDSSYESEGLDYPVPYVRWTVERNLQSILTLLKNGSINVKPLISARFDFARVSDAYTALESSENLALILKYTASNESPKRSVVKLHENIATKKDGSKIAVIGGGAYALRHLAPVLKAASQRKADMKWVASRGGGTAHHFAKQINAQFLTTDVQKLFSDPEVGSVFVMTPHASHAKYVLEAIRNGKDVFVEKPLCLTLEELAEIKESYLNANSRSKLVVGFNRRFAPLTQKLLEELKTVNGPLSVEISINAGPPPLDHWAIDPAIGGGRLLGEGCHFVDLACVLIQSEIRSISAHAVGSTSTNDSFTILLSAANGSAATITYTAAGSKRFPKERILVSGGGKTWELDNFRKLRVHSKLRTKTHKLWKQDKGQDECFNMFIGTRADNALQRDVQSYFESTEVTLLANKSLIERTTIHRT